MCSNKTQQVNLNAFDLIKGINEDEILKKKNFSFGCRCIVKGYHVHQI